MTLRELAKSANVSLSTASKAFRDAKDVSRETKERIFAVARENGCFGKYYKGKYPKKVIALVCPELISEYYAKFVECFERAVRRAGGILTVSTDGFEKSRQSELLEYYAGYGGCDGVIVFTLRGLKKGYDVPVISVGGTSAKTDSIIIDFESGISDALGHLASLGHKRIGFIGEKLTDEKCECVKCEAQKRGLYLLAQDIVIPDSRFEEAGIDGARELVNRKSKCTAIVCAYDYIAIGAIKYYKSVGIDVPKDISVVGMDNIGVTEYMTPALTTVNTHTEELCAMAVELMWKKLDNRWFTARQQISVKTDFLVRATTAKCKTI